MNKCNSVACPPPTLCPDYAAFGKMEKDTPYMLAPHAEMCTRGCLRREFSRSSYCVHVTTFGCIFVNMYRIVCLQNPAFQPYYFSHINSGSFHTGPFIFTHLFSPKQLSMIPPIHILSLSQWEPGLICWRLDASGRSPSFVLLQSQCSFRVAQVRTGHTRGCLAFMGSVSHSLVWHIHTGILLEGIVKGFGSIPPALSYINAQTTTLSMPFFGPLTFEGVGPLVQSVWQNNRCLIVLTRLLSGWK